MFGRNNAKISNLGDNKSGSPEKHEPEKHEYERHVVEKNVLEKQGLVCEHLGKKYGKKLVVRDVSISVKQGEAVGLLGPNGAGKTTCFYMITGLVQPDYGRITLAGNDITSLPMYRRARLGVSYLPQESSIFRGLTVGENIMAILQISYQDSSKRRQILQELLHEFAIEHLQNAPASQLSGGERRRAEIARALASNPSYILLDEPLAGIDPIAVNDIRQIVAKLKQRAIGVLITDHNVRETLDIIDRAYIIHDGVVLVEGTAEEIVTNPDVKRVYLGESFNL